MAMTVSLPCSARSPSISSRYAFTASLLSSRKVVLLPANCVSPPIASAQRGHIRGTFLAWTNHASTNNNSNRNRVGAITLRTANRASQEGAYSRHILSVDQSRRDA
eukprot:167981-Prorocentrum_minimum.AAC.1